MKTKMISKLTAIVLVVALLLTFAACGKGASSSSGVSSQIVSAGSSSQEAASQAPKTEVKVAALKGPTGISMVKLMQDNDAGKSANRYDFTLAGAPDEIVGKITTKEIDIAAVPTNLAATLYNKTQGNVQVLAINTLGMLSILETGDTVHSVADLKGKTVYASGQGSTAEYILRHILVKNGLDPDVDVTIEWMSEHSEIAAQAAAGKIGLCMLPEPFVTTTLSQAQGMRTALNLTAEWDKIYEAQDTPQPLTMGCIIVRKDWVQANKEALSAFLTEYKASAEYVNTNLEETAALCETYTLIPKAQVAKQAIPNCNIVYLDGVQMKTSLQTFYNVLFAANPKSIGGAMPGDDFYYE